MTTTTTYQYGNEEGATIEILSGELVVGTVGDVKRVVEEGVPDAYGGIYGDYIVTRSATDPIWRFADYTPAMQRRISEYEYAMETTFGVDPDWNAVASDDPARYDLTDDEVACIEYMEQHYNDIPDDDDPYEDGYDEAGPFDDDPSPYWRDDVEAQ